MTFSGATALAAVGSVTEYPLASGSNPTAITTGSDGNVWVAETNTMKLASITTAGLITEHPVDNLVTGLTAGPDGNLWFTEFYANKVGRMTTAGVVTYFTVPGTNGNSAGGTEITTGPDGNLWFTDYCPPCGVQWVAKMTTGGVFTEYPVSGDPKGIVAGPDGNVWVTEFIGNKVAKITTSGLVVEYPVPTGSSSPTGITVGPDGNLWFTENQGNKVAKITTAGQITEYSVTTASSGPSGIAAGSDGSLWFTENQGDQIGRITTSGTVMEYAIPTASSGPTGIAPGPDGNLWFTESSADKVGKVSAIPSCTAASTPTTTSLPSTRQYSLSNSDGATWQEMDTTHLRVFCEPTATQSTLLTANADLFTGNAGFNQDIGIFVSDNGGGDQLLAWKESGGFAGVFSPNAAYVQTLFTMTSGHSYVFKLKWKTNKPAPGATIYAGAGSGPFSPTSLTAETFPSTEATNFAVSTMQYSLSNSDGVAWMPIDGTNLATTVSPSTNLTAVLGANADLFTGKAGYNQDIGIFVSDNAGADALVAWKESGGFAGTFSPNAAFVKAVYPMTGGHTYVFKLKWKTNKPASGATIYAGAGSGTFSPTSLFVNTLPGGIIPPSAVTTSQYSLPNSDGANWQLIDAALNVTVVAAAPQNSIAGANVDLWTANLGYNQDVGIFVSIDGGTDVLLAWKESGGFAGTFSPNAAYAQTQYQMASGHTYVFKLKWKTNKPAAGKTIFAAAGGAPNFSPTRLIVELTS